MRQDMGAVIEAAVWIFVGIVIVFGVVAFSGAMGWI